MSRRSPRNHRNSPKKINGLFHSAQTGEAFRCILSPLARSCEQTDPAYMDSVQRSSNVQPTEIGFDRILAQTPRST